MPKPYNSQLIIIGLFLLVFTGCATVPMATEQQRFAALTFQPPKGKAALYVYRRSGFVGSAIAHPVNLDGRILGNNGPGTFLFTTLSPGEHVVSAGVSQVSINAKAGAAYFVRQTADMTMSGTMHTSSVRLVPEDEGKRGVNECKQAAVNF